MKPNGGDQPDKTTITSGTENRTYRQPRANTGHPINHRDITIKSRTQTNEKPRAKGTYVLPEKKKKTLEP